MSVRPGMTWTLCIESGLAATRIPEAFADFAGFQSQLLRLAPFFPGRVHTVGLREKSVFQLFATILC